jgi:hypothetical protein
VPQATPKRSGAASDKALITFRLLADGIRDRAIFPVHTAGTGVS